MDNPFLTEEIPSLVLLNNINLFYLNDITNLFILKIIDRLEPESDNEEDEE